MIGQQLFLLLFFPYKFAYNIWLFETKAVVMITQHVYMDIYRNDPKF